MNPTASLEYVLAGAVLALSAAAGVAGARRPMGFVGRRQVIGAALAIVALAAADWSFTHEMRGHYMRAAPSGARFESAAGLSGWGTAAAPRSHKLLIMVESLGVPVRDAELERRLFAFYRTPAVRARYDVTTGTSLYYNSTTAGEVRELCGRWGDYYELVEQRDDGCLPARLAARGYDTQAWHSVAGTYFDRARWYPNVGFAHRAFRDELQARGAQLCGGVFPGVCDRDVPRLIGQTLASADKPTFLYWLTVNSHLPVPPGMNLGGDRCQRISPHLARDLPMICRQVAIWDAIDRAMVAAITADDFPATDILIVGDHMPPYFDWKHRQEFDPARVPWIRLTPRNGGSA